MNNLNVFIRSSVIGVALATLVISPVFACHPLGTINKSVEDITTGSALVDANSDSAALSVNSGDTLKYVIKITDNGSVANTSEADMIHTVLTDSLPAGVQLLNDPSETQISNNIGTVKDDASVTETYEVKVTSTVNDEYIANTACYTGRGVDQGTDQSGCDVAIVKVHVPTPVPTPTPTLTTSPTPTPTTPPSLVSAAAPMVLPNTGPGNFIVLAIVVSVFGYAGYLLRLKRKATQNS